MIHRYFLLFITAWMVAVNADAQEKLHWRNTRSLLSFNAGVSIPILCYASTDLNKTTSGFAKTGFTVNINYRYLFSMNTGLFASIYYSGNNAGTSTVSSSRPGYRYFGVLTGPLLKKKFTDKWEGDINLVAGIARVFSPRLVQNDVILLGKHQSTAFVWGAGARLHYRLSANTYLSFSGDHVNLKPQFKFKQGEASKGEQHIVVMNVDAGIGLKF